jgi:hypothetical protein
MEKRPAVEEIGNDFNVGVVEEDISVTPADQFTNDEGPPIDRPARRLVQGRHLGVVASMSREFANMPEFVRKRGSFLSF